MANGRRGLFLYLCFGLCTGTALAGPLGCATDEGDGDVEESEGAVLDLGLPRGRETKTFAVPGRSTVERCVLPNHVAGGDYEGDDDKSEAELCEYNFHAAAPGTAVAICPKLVSTNTGVDVHELMTGKDQDATEAAMCSRDEGRTKLLAKFKQSITCSYTPSVLGYYHLSRMLGGAGAVKPAVIRTMDLEEHKKITAKGIANSRDLLNTLWKQYASTEASPAASKRKDALFTSDLLQIYGAMQENPRGETKYSEINRRGKESTDGSGYAQPFLASSQFARVADGRPVSQIAGRGLAEAAQIVVQMKDISDMVLMDYVMSQQDRFGNIHAVDYFYWVDASGEVKKVKKSKVDEGETPMPQGAVPVRKMLLKDNDCGVTKTNVAKAAGILGKLRHMSPKTYASFRWLARDFAAPDSAIASFFSKEVLMTASDVKNTRVLVAEAAKTIEQNCRAGKLLLDLDLEGHLEGTNTHDASLCEAASPPAGEKE